MNKQILCFILLTGILSILNCHSEQINSQWKQRVITVDGRASDWEGSDLKFFDDLNLTMTSTNDSINLYIMLRTSEYSIAQRIKRMGITIWLDNTGRKNKTYGIRYTGSENLINEPRPPMDTPSDFLEEESSVNERDRRRPPDRFRADLPAPGNIHFIQGNEQVTLPENNTEGPIAGSGVQNGFFCYEFRIPITSELESGAAINLCLELGGIKSEDMQKMRRPAGMGDEGGMGGREGMGGPPGGMAGERMGGGRGGPGGMGRPGEMGGPGERPDRKQMEPREIWMKIILAEK